MKQAEPKQKETFPLDAVELWSQVPEASISKGFVAVGLSLVGAR